MGLGGGEMSKYGKIWKEREQRRGREEGESNDVRLESEHRRKKDAKEKERRREQMRDRC